MKPERSILTAFLLNLAFSVFECAGGLLTGSVAILSDAVHDLGDALGIGFALVLERKSRRPPDITCTFGYARYSVLGGVLTSGILLLGSAAVICTAVGHLSSPPEIDYNGMIVFALAGVAVNGAAAWLTRGSASLNRRAVSLHMLEDVLGWAAVLVGALVMRWTDAALIDPILSIAVAKVFLAPTLTSSSEIIASDANSIRKFEINEASLRVIRLRSARIIKAEKHIKQILCNVGLNALTPSYSSSLPASAPESTCPARYVREPVATTTAMASPSTIALPA